jgi:hypothetical protein
MVNDCLWHHPERFNTYHTSFTQRITLHLSEERQAKNKMQKHKDILVAVPKSIYNNLLYVIAIGQTVQSSSKAPSAHEPLANVGGKKYICVFPMNLDKSNLVQYSFTLGTSCRQQKKKIFYPAS